MRSTWRLNDRDPRGQNKTASALQWILCAGALMAGLAAVLAGLFALLVQPVTGVLLLIFAMASLLYAADGFCQGPGAFRSK